MNAQIKFTDTLSSNELIILLLTVHEMTCVPPNNVAWTPLDEFRDTLHEKTSRTQLINNPPLHYLQHYKNKHT